MFKEDDYNGIRFIGVGFLMLYYEGSMCLIENFLLNLQVYKILSYFVFLTKKHSLYH